MTQFIAAVNTSMRPLWTTAGTSVDVEHTLDRRRHQGKTRRAVGSSRGVDQPACEVVQVRTVGVA